MPFLRTLADRQRKKGSADIIAYSTQFKRIVRALIDQHKISQYSACAEYFGGLPELLQDQVQRGLDISFTQPDRLDINRVIQGVIDIEDRKLERKRMLHSATGPMNIGSLPVAAALHTVPNDPARNSGYTVRPCYTGLHKSGDACPVYQGSDIRK